MGVHDLRDADGAKLEGLVKEAPSLVRFHWDQCGHCHMMKEDWDKVGKEMGHKGVHVIDVEMSALSHVPSNLKENIDGYPTIRAMFDNGAKQVNYEGERSADKMMDWFKEESKKHRHSLSGGKAKKSRKAKKQTKKHAKKHAKKHTKRHTKKASKSRKSRKVRKARK